MAAMKTAWAFLIGQKSCFMSLVFWHNILEVDVWRQKKLRSIFIMDVTEHFSLSQRIEVLTRQFPPQDKD